MAMREASRLSAAGVAMGLAASLLLARSVQSMLYGIAPYDPLTFSGTALLLVRAALKASWIPSRRVADVQPVVTLRSE